MREPLLSLVARADRLLGHEDGAVRDEARQTRAAALTSLMQLEELRDLSGLEHRRTQLRLADCDLAALVRSIARQFEPVAASRGLELIVESAVRLRGRGDAEKVTSIVSNLLGNAIRYAPVGGRVRVTLEVRQENVILEVADNGPGIPAAERETVFQRAWRGPGSSYRRPDGRGLGLAIVNQLIEVHLGSIRVEDAPEGGALLIVTLPYLQPEHGGQDASLRDLAHRQLTAEVVVADLQRRFGRDATDRRTEPGPGADRRASRA
jgi:signal transduction histidine kinase